MVSYRWEKEASSAAAVDKAHTPQEIADSGHGFGGLSRRTKTCKPIIAAVEGGAYGGGVEILLNCDMVIADETAKFALPEVRVGVTAGAGGELTSFLYKLLSGT